jgi:hypothetical protein
MEPLEPGTVALDVGSIGFADEAGFTIPLEPGFTESLEPGLPGSVTPDEELGLSTTPVPGS